jgi:hypothetical protein
MARTILVSVILVAGCLTSVTARQAAPTNVRIMAGLNNPRGLALGPNGAVYVAEAGAGGAGPCRVAPTNETRCFGLTGAISRFFNGTQARIITGLPSHALPGGEAANGPNDLSFQNTGDMFVVMGLGFDPVDRRFFGDAGASFGKLLQISEGQIREAGDVTAYERDVNPGGGPPDSNPYGVLVLQSVRVVADAGANAVVSVIASGLVNTVAVFPSRPNRATDAVPTAIAVGPDGAYYVGELSGVPFATGAANVIALLRARRRKCFGAALQPLPTSTSGPTAASMLSSPRPVRSSLPCQAISSESDPTERERSLSRTWIDRHQWSSMAAEPSITRTAASPPAPVRYGNTRRKRLLFFSRAVAFSASRSD